MTNQLVTIPFHGTSITAQDIDGVPHVALRPLCEAIGLSYSGQYERLQRQPWATVRVTRTVAADGRERDMVMIDRRSFGMWLATMIAGDTFAPARVGVLAAGGPISVTVNVAGTNLTPSDIEAAAVRGVERAVRNARERG